MSETLPAERTIAPASSVLSDPLVLIGLVIGFTPVLAGLIFRTYGYHVAPDWAEVLRQLDFPFIFVELAVVMWAHHGGMTFRSTFKQLDLPAQYALIVFLCTFWISSAAVSADPTYSLVRASFWLVHIGFAFAIYNLAAGSPAASLRRCGAAALLGFAAFLPLTALHLVNAPDPPLVREGRIIWSSAIPGCLSIRHLGIWAAIVLACAIGALAARDLTARRRAVAHLFIFAATATIFWSGTRAGVYGTAGALVILLATLRTVPQWRTMLAPCAAVALGIVVSELWLPPDAAFGFFRRVTMAEGDNLQQFSAGRTVLWAAMMQAFAAKPIFGLGEGAVQWLAVVGEVRHVQPHNSVVQMLSSWGLIACSAAGYLLSRLLCLVHRMARREAMAIPIVLMMDCLLIMSLVDGVFYFSRFIMWFAGGAGVIVAMAVRNTSVDLVLQKPRRLSFKGFD